MARCLLKDVADVMWFMIVAFVLAMSILLAIGTVLQFFFPPPAPRKATAADVTCDYQTSTILVRAGNYNSTLSEILDLCPDMGNQVTVSAEQPGMTVKGL